MFIYFLFNRIPLQQLSRVHVFGCVQAVCRPSNPVQYLAAFLLKNDPCSPPEQTEIKVTDDNNVSIAIDNEKENSYPTQGGWKHIPFVLIFGAWIYETQDFTYIKMFSNHDIIQ